jgi:predicted alpha/beta-fold hydrolase
MSRHSEIYSAPWWLPGPHGQTIWGKLFRRRRKLPLRRRIIKTADEDELELVSIDAPAGAPHLLLLHGLEGSVRSHYANGILATAAESGWAAHLLLFRSCGDRINRTRRFYHSGDTADVRTAIRRLIEEFPSASICLVGVSLGGNVLLKYLGEDPVAVPPNISAAAAVSVPYDLAISARSISNGFSRVYQKFFLTTLKEKLLEKRRLFADLPEESAIRRIRTMVEFDDLVTAPLHGFEGAADYYYKSSAIRFLDGIRLPTLLLSSYDDPFLPPGVLNEVERQARENPALHIEFHRKGGHVGFIYGRWPWRAEYYIDRRIFEFFWKFTHSTP